MKSLIILILAIIAVVSAKRMCVSSGDPHYRTFAGRKVNNYYRGTLLMAKTSNFEVHSKTGVWNKRYSVNVATGIKVGGCKIVLEDKYNNVAKINGVNQKLKTGRNVFNGVVIDKRGSRVFVRKSGEYVSVQTNYNAGWKKYGSTTYQNVIVYGNAKNVGICGTGKTSATATGIFKNTIKRTKVVSVDHCTKKQRSVACAHCKKRFGTTSGVFYNNCVFDVCRGLKAKWAATYAKTIRMWRKVVTKYNKLRKSNLKMAKIYYRKQLKHLEQMRTHGRKYRAHMKRANYYQKKHSAHHSKYIFHKKKSAYHHSKKNLHKKLASKYKKSSKIYKRHAYIWKCKIREIRKEINKCRRPIRNNRNKMKTAVSKFNYYKRLAAIAVSRSSGHKRAASAHLRSAIWHSKYSNKHLKHKNANKKASKFHRKMAGIHLKKHVYHNKKYHATRRLRIKHINHASYWLKKIRKRRTQIKHLTKLWASQFKKEVRVTKTLVIKSKKCPSTPSYLDNVKFCHADDAFYNAEKRCSHASKFIEYSCVYDHSVGLFHTKKQYINLAALEKRQKATHNHKLTCTSWGDPHVKAFSNKKFNIYRTKGWKNMYVNNKERVHIKTYMGYSRRWGTQSLNKWAWFRFGKQTILFKPYGKLGYNTNGWSCKKNHKHFKQWVRTYNGSTYTVNWNRAGAGGYYSIYIVASRGQVRKCTSGYCCNGIKRGRKIRLTGGAKKRMGDIDDIEFNSRCQRKTTAFRICSYKYRNYHGSRAVKAIKNCVSQRKHL